MPTLSRRIIALMAAALATSPAIAVAQSPAAAAAQEAPHATGVVRLQSANSFDETLVRLKADVQAKGIRFFDAIDQSRLGAQVNLQTARSTLVLFGNPPLGLQFLRSNPFAGLDWPVRMLVVQKADHSVWVAWSDFGFIAERYRITDKTRSSRWPARSRCRLLSPRPRIDSVVHVRRLRCQRT